MSANPLAAVNKVEGAAKRKRRAMSDDEVSKLLAAAPADRKLVYRVALAIGLRRAELAAIEWGDLRLNAIRPYALLRAEATKARRADRLPLPESLAADLRTLRPANASDGAKVFGRVPSLELWRHDLKDAGIREADGQGRKADFHGGTRKTLCTRMHRAGLPLATAMRIMRHTDARLTLVDYADDEQLGIDEAMATLPEVVAATPAAPIAAAAGA